MSYQMNSTIFMSIIGFLLGCGVSLIFYTSAKKKINTFFYVLLAGYVGALLGSTLFPLGSYGMKSVETMAMFINVIPFASNSGVMSHPEVIQCALNVIMFMPLGILIPLTTGKRIRIRNFIALCFILSLSIEVTQLVGTSLGIMFRSFDVNDLIFNTLGGSFTYAFVSLIDRCIQIEKRQVNDLS